MSPQLPAPVLRILLGHLLERLRRKAFLKQEEVAGILRWSQQRVDYVESGGGIKRSELEAMLDEYGATEPDEKYALELHAEITRKGRQAGFRARFRHYLRLLIDMEPTCQRLYSYRSMVVPGLLQTEDYMRTLFAAWRPSPTVEQIDRDIHDRVARQAILNNSGQEFWFVIDEAVLRRMAGGPRIARSQVARLLEIMDMPNVTLQVVPFSAGYYIGQASDHTIFGYDIEPEVNIVYLDQHDGGEYVDNIKRMRKYMTLWEQQKAASLNPAHTRRVLLELSSSF